MDNPKTQQQIDLKNTIKVLNSSGKNLFTQGFVLRKISKFVAGTSEDAYVPVPVFYDPKTFKILKDTLIPELRGELKDELI